MLECLALLEGFRAFSKNIGRQPTIRLPVRRDLGRSDFQHMTFVPGAQDMNAGIIAMNIDSIVLDEHRNRT